MSKMIIIALFLIGIGYASSWCYQESANASTACGGLSTGIYVNTTGPSHPGDLPAILINYTKPVGSLNNSLWQVDTGVFGIVNYSIPEGCWNQSPLQLAIETKDTDDGGWYAGMFLECWDGSAWNQGGNYIAYYDDVETGSCSGMVNAADSWEYAVDGDYSTYALGISGSPLLFSNSSTCLNARIYEEGMWWDINTPTPAATPSTTNMIIGLLGLMIVVVLITLILRMDVTVKNLIAVMILAIIAINVIIPYLLSAIGTVA